MSSIDPRRKVVRKTQFESLEDRLAMSADPLGGLLGGSIQHHTFADEPTGSIEHHLAHHVQQSPDFWIDPADDYDLEQHLHEIEQALSSAHGQTGLTQVQNDYGFFGGGQTVAIIDSGVAYTHYALGGGFGATYRVVGGYDFTEAGADALDPYDDGPNGGHGTHVSGIVGGNAGTNSGVAPEVDLVGLRVFDDAGAGYFSWVEQALDWVHANRSAFENPITAVNLSLGTSWNSDTVPNWAMLEDEFSQLKADGIFISVSAGNSFQDYNAPGLSYPAASSHVVPVMSTDDNGSLSYFSQRHERAIAAPGRSITSTVPDYAAGDADTIDDDFASWSGTSMAAPYVAGASVIIRQAMEFVGYSNITQDTIYNHIVATADQFYDSATSAWYNRLNLEAAIDALMPADDYGSTVEGAYDLGTLSDDSQLSGLIGTLSDADYFQFTAGASGTLTISATGSHQLDVAWTGSGTVDGDTHTLDVVQGQTYTFGLSTSDGVGYYDLDLTFEELVDQAPVTIKTVVRSDGMVYSLDSDGWMSVNGTKIWSNTYDFDVGSDWTIYWHAKTGLLQYRPYGGSWKTADHDAIKFEVGSDGSLYSVGTSNWMTHNGSHIWKGTGDFHIGADNSVYWQSTIGLLQRRAPSGQWQTIAQGVNDFAVRDNGLVYGLGTDNWLKINGSSTWKNTQSFAFTEDQTLYWHATNGLLQRLPNGGSWQNIDFGVAEFAIRHDGAVYSLTNDGRLNINGVTEWTNVQDIRLNEFGCLTVEKTSGAEFTLSGRFKLGMNGSVQTASMGQQSTGGAGGSYSSISLVSQAFVTTTAHADLFATESTVGAADGHGFRQSLLHNVAGRHAHELADLTFALPTASKTAPVQWEAFDGPADEFDELAHHAASGVDAGLVSESVDSLFEEFGAHV